MGVMISLDDGMKITGKKLAISVTCLLAGLFILIYTFVSPGASSTAMLRGTSMTGESGISSTKVSFLKGMMMSLMRLPLSITPTQAKPGETMQWSGLLALSCPSCANNLVDNKVDIHAYWYDPSGVLREHSYFSGYTTSSGVHCGDNFYFVVFYNLPTDAPTGTWKVTVKYTAYQKESCVLAQTTETFTVSGSTPTLPDLIITDIWEQAGKICYSVRNQGGSDTGRTSYQYLFIDGVQGEYDKVDSIPAGSTVTSCFSQTVWSCTGDSDSVRVLADGPNNIAENNEANNALVETWACPVPVVVTGLLTLEFLGLVGGLSLLTMGVIILFI